jgi:phosphoribosylglycinamide formyltransferase 2
MTLSSLSSLQTLSPWGTPLQDDAQRLMLLGSGELGREVAIEAMRLGLEVIAVDAYPQAPAMQIAHRSHVINMLDGAALRTLIEQERPSLIVPEIEAIATPTLMELEQEGWRVVPTARATFLTMNREGIRRLAAEELGLRTSPYRFAETEVEYRQAIEALGLPCVVKPVMSSSGKGQSTVRAEAEIGAAWDYSQAGGRTKNSKVIVEGFVEFETEMTLLTVRSIDGTHFCPPIGHVQVGGDYRESWQPCALSPEVLRRCEEVGAKITEALGGWGLFGVELFIQGETVFFSEVSPRPHDTGMVTMVSQNMSEFELHVRSIAGLPIGAIELTGAGASAVILASQKSDRPRFTGVDAALRVPGSKLRLFGKPTAHPNRRMGVALAIGANVQEARARAKAAAAAVQVMEQKCI